MFVRFRFEMFPVHALADVRMRLQTMLLQAMTFQRFLDGVEKRQRARAGSRPTEFPA